MALDLGLRELAASLAEESGATQPFGTYVLPSSDAQAELGRWVERDVFAEFFGNTPELLAAEYEPYESASMFLVVIDHRRLVPAGVMRVLVPSPAGHKSLHDIPRVWGEACDEVLARSGAPIDLSNCFDVATFAIARDYRGPASEGLVSLALYQALVQTANVYGARWFVAIVDVAVLDAIEERMASFFTKFVGLQPVCYLDSPASIAGYVDLDSYRARLPAIDRSIYETLFDGTGLEAAVSTPDWDDSTSRAVASLTANIPAR